MEQKPVEQAGRTDLARFMQTYHPDGIRVSSGCVRLKRDSGLYAGTGDSGGTRSSTAETGNPIDFPVNIQRLVTRFRRIPVL